MRQQEQHKNSQPEQKLRTTGQSARRSGGGIFRIPRGKGFFVLLVIVILASYYQSAIVGFFTTKAAVQPPQYWMNASFHLSVTQLNLPP